MRNKATLIKTAALSLLILSFLTAAAVFAGCDRVEEESTSENNNETESETTLFSFSDVELTGGDSFRIVPEFSKNASISYDEIVYSVADGEDVVSVDGYYVTAKAEGNALIRAEYVADRSVFATFKVNVSMKGELYKISEYVFASRKGGVYPSAFGLTLEPSADSYTIYYTTDCSVPTPSSAKIDGPLSIRDQTLSGTYPLTSSVLSEPIDGAGLGKCVSNDYLYNIEYPGNYPKIGCGTVITYSVYDGDTLLETSSVTYIVKKGADSYFTIPIVCLSMPYENWFDSEEGIYNIVYHDLKSRANLEYYDPTTGESFTVNTSVKVGGGWSRGFPKRTLNLNFNRDEEGIKNSPSNVAFFGETTTEADSSTLISGITRLRLHNSGNTYESGNMFGDAFFQAIAEGANCSTTSYRPCLVYLNGEFWGYYGLREKYSGAYFENNYGVDDDDVVISKLTGNTWETTEGDPDANEEYLKEFKSFYTKKNFKSEKVYNELITKYIDKDSFIDALILEAFAHNWDYVANSNNLQMWRTSVIKEGVPYYDGKLRICMHDLDFALQHNTGNYLVPKEYTGTKSNDYSYDRFILYHNLLSNESFRADLAARTKELFETILAPERTTAILDRMAAELEPFFDDNAARWGMGYTKQAWLDQINILRTRLSTRADYFVATTLAMYEPFEDDGSTLVVVDNLNSDESLNNSREFKVGSRVFEVEFYVNNDKYSSSNARAFIRFAAGDKYFKIYWGTGMTSSQWMSGSVQEGASSADIDYINVGKHKINIKYQKGSVELTVDDVFTKSFKVASDFGTVETFTFGSMQCKISCNRIKLILNYGLGSYKEIDY